MKEVGRIGVLEMWTRAGGPAHLPAAMMLASDPRAIPFEKGPFLDIFGDINMIALIAGMDNRGFSMRHKDRRKSLVEHLERYRRSLTETVDFKANVLSPTERSKSMDMSELQGLIQKFGRAALVSQGRGDICRAASGSSRYHAIVPSEEELMWILSVSSRLKKNVMIACEKQFALVWLATCTVFIDLE